MNKIDYTLLTILDRNPRPMTSAEIAEGLLQHGIEMPERTVRHHLKGLDQKGLTESRGKRGRLITEAGRAELNQGLVSERIGFISNVINNYSFRTDFNIDSMAGKIILNVSYLDPQDLRRALDVMKPVLNSPYSMSSRIVVARGGEKLGDLRVPQDKVAIGTVCSITLNGIFLKSCIPVHSRFGGIVEIADGRPVSFLSVISYEGSTVAPLEIFIKSRMTDVLGALHEGEGKILGSFREIPEVSLPDAGKLNEKMKRNAFGGVILFGQPGETLLGIPVTPGKVGMVVLGGLNPIAALEEAGITTQSHALATMADYLELSPVEVIDAGGIAVAQSQAAAHTEKGFHYREHSKDNYWSIFQGLKQSTF